MLLGLNEINCSYYFLFAKVQNKSSRAKFALVFFELRGKKTTSEVEKTVKIAIERGHGF
jgi:hypothetical protein